MVKIFKLLVIAATLIGTFVLLMKIAFPAQDTDDIDIKSERGEEWKAKIDKMCTEGSWSVEKYKDLASGIHTDNKTTNGNLISNEEELSLKNYLFAMSCQYLYNGVDGLFQQSSYPTGKVEFYEKAKSLLEEQSKEFGKNSNLTSASGLLSEYSTLTSLLNYSVSAHYSNPLKVYSANGLQGRAKKIEGLSHYGTHFSNNTDICNRVDRLKADARNAENSYYAKLELCIEEHYKHTKDMIQLLEDQIRFNQISTNKTAVNRLKSFVNNL